MFVRSIDDLLAPTPWSAFQEEVWGKKYCHIPAQTPAKLDGLFSWEKLSEALETHRFEFPRLRLMMGGTSVRAERYTKRLPGARSWEDVRLERLDAKKLMNCLTEGATLGLRTVDELSATVRELCESLESFFRCRVHANLYASWREIAGFNAHFDAHDVFVLQIAGRKLWRIYSSPKAFPLEGVQGQLPTGTVEWERLLEQGDVLYIPRGWWHSATPVNEPTMHLTVGTYNLTGVDVVAKLVSLALNHDLFRMDLPIFADERARAEHGDRLLTILNQLWTAGLLDQVCTSRPDYRLRLDLPNLS